MRDEDVDSAVSSFPTASRCDGDGKWNENCSWGSSWNGSGAAVSVSPYDDASETSSSFQRIRLSVQGFSFIVRCVSSSLAFIWLFASPWRGVNPSTPLRTGRDPYGIAHQESPRMIEHVGQSRQAWMRRANSASSCTKPSKYAMKAAKL